MFVIVILREMSVVVLHIKYLLVNLFYKKYIVTIREFSLMNN